MFDSPYAYIMLNVLYIFLFRLIFIVGMVFYITNKKRLAQKTIAYPFTVLGILGAIFFAEAGIVSNIVNLTIFFTLIYLFFLFIGIYAMRWKPPQIRQTYG